MDVGDNLDPIVTGLRELQEETCIDVDKTTAYISKGNQYLLNNGRYNTNYCVININLKSTNITISKIPSKKQVSSKNYKVFVMPYILPADFDDFVMKLQNIPTTGEDAIVSFVFIQVRELLRYMNADSTIIPSDEKGIKSGYALKRAVSIDPVNYRPKIK
jgi:hypothetical protein